MVINNFSAKKQVKHCTVRTTVECIKSLPDMERSYVQMVAHLQNDTGAIVAVGNYNKEGEAVEDGQL